LSPIIGSRHDVLNWASCEAPLFANHPHCYENLVSRIRKQEVQNAELKRQQCDLIKRIEALETASNCAATSINRSPARRRPHERFFNKDLLRVKASLFVVGRPLTPDYCKDPVSNLYENEPTLEFNIDTVKAVNESKRCADAPSLSKWAVLELFSLGELAGRNCTGRSSTSSEYKQPLDQIKLKFIQECVMKIYPLRSDGARGEVWNKCAEKINSELRYLFGTSLKKHAWLDVGLCFY